MNNEILNFSVYVLSIIFIITTVFNIILFFNIPISYLNKFIYIDCKIPKLIIISTIILLFFITSCFFYAQFEIRNWEKKILTKLSQNQVINQNDLKFNFLQSFFVMSSNNLVTKYTCDLTYSKDLSILIFLRDQGYNLNSHNESGFNPTLCLRANEELLLEFIKIGGNINNVNKINGWSIFHYISENQSLSLDTIKKILSLPNADLNITAYDGRTALHNAAYYGNDSLIIILLNHGADKNIRNISGDLPVSWALQQKKYSSAKLLM